MYGVEQCRALCSIATCDDFADNSHMLLLLPVLLLAAAACCRSVYSFGAVAAVVPDVAVCSDCCKWLPLICSSCTIHPTAIWLLQLSLV
jgi:hypothetical protein